jgi:hypothetical protein
VWKPFGSFICLLLFPLICVLTVLSLTQVVQGIEPASHIEAPGEPATISNLAADGNDHNVFHRGSNDPLSEKCQQVNPAEDVGRCTDNPLLQPETPVEGSVIDLSVMGDA